MERMWNLIPVLSKALSAPLCWPNSTATGRLLFIRQPLRVTSRVDHSSQQTVSCSVGTTPVISAWWRLTHNDMKNIHSCNTNPWHVDLKASVLPIHHSTLGCYASELWHVTWLALSALHDTIIYSRNARDDVCNLSLKSHNKCINISRYIAQMIKNHQHSLTVI